MPLSQTETPEIAVLKVQMTDVKSALADLKTDQHNNFTTLSVKLDALSNIPTTIDDHEKRITSLELSKSKAWLWNVIFAAIGGVFIYLVQYALEHH